MHMQEGGKLSYPEPYCDQIELVSLANDTLFEKFNIITPELSIDQEQFSLYDTSPLPFSVLGDNPCRYMMGSQQSVLNQLVSFLLGASVALVLLFFLSSAGLGARSTAGISSWTNPPAQEANMTSKAAHAEEKASQVSEIQITKLQFLLTSL